jgi:hypothetical protein
MSAWSGKFSHAKSAARTGLQAKKNPEHSPRVFRIADRSFSEERIYDPGNDLTEDGVGQEAFQIHWAAIQRIVIPG